MKKKKTAFGRRLTNCGSQSWSRNKSWSEPGSINLDLDPMTTSFRSRTCLLLFRINEPITLDIDQIMS